MTTQIATYHRMDGTNSNYYRASVRFATIDVKDARKEGWMRIDNEDGTFTYIKVRDVSGPNSGLNCCKVFCAKHAIEYNEIFVNSKKQ